MWKSWRRRESPRIGEKTDYDSATLTWREGLACVSKCCVVTGAFAYMFYRSWLGLVILPGVIVFGIRRERKQKIRLRRERLALQFKDTIEAVISGMQAGYSIENAFLEAEGEILSLHGRGCEMGKELAQIRKGLQNRIPLEEMLLNFGERSHVEEIKDFTEVFSIAKRMGGNLKEIVRRTAALTQQRMEVEREIAAMLASQKYEQKVMNMIPFLLFGYLQLSSPGFFDILYHNTAGIAVMTLGLVIYLAAWLLAERIVDIRL